MIKEGKFTLLESAARWRKLPSTGRKRKRGHPGCDSTQFVSFRRMRTTILIAVVLTTGAGDVAYCSGRDLSEFPTEGGKNRGTRPPRRAAGISCRQVIRTFPKVTIAVVNGFCLGGGITLLLRMISRCIR